MIAVLCETLTDICPSADNDVAVLAVSTDAQGDALDIELPAPLEDGLDVELPKLTIELCDLVKNADSLKDTDVG